MQITRILVLEKNSLRKIRVSGTVEGPLQILKNPPFVRT